MNRADSSTPRSQCVVCLFAHYGSPAHTAPSLEGDCPKGGKHSDVVTALAVMFFGDSRPFIELGMRLGALPQELPQACNTCRGAREVLSGGPAGSGHATRLKCCPTCGVRS